MSGLKNFLIRLAKKYLGLVDKVENTQLAYLQDMNGQVLAMQDAAKDLFKQVHSLEIQNKSLNKTIATMREKYPSVWLKGNVAQGAVQLPNLGIAVEFFREENKFCVFVPWNDASGKKPTEFVPPFLEVDENLKIEGAPDTMNGNGIVYKIPIKGWDDTINLTTKAGASHESYGLDGRMQEKVRSFKNSLGMNGLFKREVIEHPDNSYEVYCLVMFHQDEAGPDPFYNVQSTMSLLPKGNMVHDPARETVKYWTMGEKPNRFYCWRIPVTEIDTPKLGYQKKKAIAAAAREVGYLPPGTELGNS